VVLIFPIEFADVITMSHEDPRFPRFFPGDPTEVIGESPVQSPVERLADSDDLSRSRSTAPTTGHRHPLMPGFMSHVAVGFGIAKAISAAQRA
jgi:hypothetical protein